MKNNSPVEQVDGKLLPTFMLLVKTAPEKSTSFVCVRKSTSVCALHTVVIRQISIVFIEKQVLFSLDLHTSRL